ncbi:MAG: hypothetical protein WDM94_06420 [Bauldia sp.]
MAFKPKKRPPPKPPAKPAPRKRATETVASEHRIAITGVALAVGYGRDRTERMELRGTATLNASAAGGGTRTTGFVALALKKGAKIANRVSYAPASLNRNLAFTLYVDEADLALLREVFVTGTGPEAADPALIFWARTVAALDVGTAATEPVTEFGFRLDFAPGN